MLYLLLQAADPLTALFDAGGATADGFVAQLRGASGACGPGSDLDWTMRLTAMAGTTWANRVATRRCADGATVNVHVDAAAAGSLVAHRCASDGTCDSDTAIDPDATVSRRVGDPRASPGVASLVRFGRTNATTRAVPLAALDSSAIRHLMKIRFSRVRISDLQQSAFSRFTRVDMTRLEGWPLTEVEVHQMLPLRRRTALQCNPGTGVTTGTHLFKVGRFEAFHSIKAALHGIARTGCLLRCQTLLI